MIMISMIITASISIAFVKKNNSNNNNNPQYSDKWNDRPDTHIKFHVTDRSQASHVAWPF